MNLSISMDPITQIETFIYERYHLPEHCTQFQKIDLTPFPPKSVDFAKNIRPKGAEKQAVSLRNGLEKQAVKSP